MLWLLYASCTAFFEALKDVTGKKTLRTLDEYTLIFGFMSIGVLTLLPVMLLTTGWPTFGPQFGLALLVGGSLNILAFILYLRAIKIAELSLTVPLITLTPLFLLFTSPIIVNEWPTWADAIGVILLIVGSYVLNLGAKNQEKDWLAPLKAIFHNQGSRLMFITAAIWSITANIDKIGTLNSSPLFWAISLYTVIAVGMIPFMMRRGQGWRETLYSLQKETKLLTLTGILNATGVGFQFLALTMAPVAQVIAVKRLSALIAVIFGYFIFGEKGLKERFLGAAIMVSGVAIMSLA
jgi:drug/metabolite transporter (DMT)-like permease